MNKSEQKKVGTFSKSAFLLHKVRGACITPSFCIQYSPASIDHIPPTTSSTTPSTTTPSTAPSSATPSSSFINQWWDITNMSTNTILHRETGGHSCFVK